MLSLPKLPFRQKCYLSITFLAGLFIFISFYWTLLEWHNLRAIIFVYGMSVPIFLLAGETVIDLNNQKIFKIWSLVAIIFLIVYLSTRNVGFVYERATDLNKATTSLKALPIFLISYWPLNNFVKRKTGFYIINTFRQSVSYNSIAKRKIKWFDIVTNLILLIVTVLGGAL